MICYQVVSTNSLRKFMEISLENLYVDIGAYIGLTEVPLYFLLQRDSSAPETL